MPHLLFLPSNVNTCMSKAWQQGHFDGLCGIYSLINSAHVLSRGLTEEKCSELFKFLIQAGGDAFPKATYDGLDFDPLYALAEQMQRHFETTLPLRLTRPFLDREVVSPDAFFDALAGELVGRKAVAVIGLGAPWDHWTVVTRITPHEVRFADSYGIKRFNRSTFSLAEQEKRIKLDFRETIVIERLPRTWTAHAVPDENK